MATSQPKNGNPPPGADTGQAQGEGGQAVYLRLMNEQLVGWDDPRGTLQRALAENQFLLLAQKILPLRSGAPDPACYEVLLRLQKEEDNLLPPGGFFDIAEGLGMMGDIDRWVVRNVIAWGAAAMKANPSSPLPMLCVNLSAAALVDHSFANFVRDQLNKSGYPPRALCFEISERDVIDLHDDTQKFIAALKPGCRITLDAFGSVKVSFSHLSGLAIDFIKIDGVITQNILRDPASLAKVRAIHAACRKIGVRAIAEFVETREMLDKMREIGVDYVQGFGIARPEPISKIQ